MGRLKVRIARSQCVGNARCHAVAEQLYPLNDEGYVAIDSFEVGSGDEVLARRGARACPERIISVIDDES